MSKRVRIYNTNGSYNLQVHDLYTDEPITLDVHDLTLTQVKTHLNDLVLEPNTLVTTYSFDSNSHLKSISKQKVKDF